MNLVDLVGLGLIRYITLIVQYYRIRIIRPTAFVSNVIHIETSIMSLILFRSSFHQHLFFFFLILNLCIFFLPQMFVCV